MQKNVCSVTDGHLCGRLVRRLKGLLVTFQEKQKNLSDKRQTEGGREGGGRRGRGRERTGLVMPDVQPCEDPVSSPFNRHHSGFLLSFPSASIVLQTPKNPWAGWTWLLCWVRCKSPLSWAPSELGRGGKDKTLGIHVSNVNWFSPHWKEGGSA